jgi:NTP pyrophosphatase (non-canonical NTP hydrolase)
MNTKEYQKAAIRTFPKLSSTFDDELHMVMGLSTEAGEVMDIYKRKLAYNKNIDYVNLKEELGDILWYVANLCNIHNWDMEDIMDININKLKVRFPEKFTEFHALNRDLIEERKILEQ